MANVAPNLVAALGGQGTELNASYVVGSGAVAGTVIAGSLTAFGPLAGVASQAITVPLAEVWWIEDIYDVGGVVSQGADAAVLMFVNGYMQNSQPALSTINLSLLTRFDLGYQIQLLPGVTFSTSISLLATAGTGATQVVKFKVNKEPYTG